MIEILIYIFAAFGALVALMIAIGLLFINPRDDRDCLTESDIYEKYKRKKQ